MPDAIPTPADLAAQQTGNTGPDQSTGSTNDATDNNSNTERTFSQEDVDRIIRDRLRKFSDYDDLKARAAEADEAAKSDLDKAVDAARKEVRAEVLAEANARLIQAEARLVATDLGFVAPVLAGKLLDVDSSYLDENGEVDSKAIKASLEALIKDTPALASAPTSDTKPSPSARDAGIGTQAGSTPKTSAELFASLVG